ncbi:hypothetical protein ABVT39_024708 [Epinephelus coioides]
MSLTAAARGFVVFLLSVSVIQGQKGWGVTYTSTEICAVKGSTVEIHCSYRYPSRIYDLDTKVEKTFWFVNMTDDVYVDLKTDPQYSGRVQYVCDETETNCTLRITDLRESDSAVYKFRFITNQPGGKYWGHPGVTLSVTDLKVSGSSSSSHLQCHSSRYLPDHTSYIWYKNGQKIKEDTSPYVDFSYDSADSYSCAVKGCENFPSPSVYSPKASGQIFTITDIRAEHSGNYYCEAQNTRGRHNSTSHLIVVADPSSSGAGKLVAAGTITVVLLAVILLAVFLWIRKKRASRDSSEPGERADNREQRQPEEQGDLQYASIHFSNNQADPLYSNMRPAQPLRHTEQREDVEYVTVKFNSARTAPRETRGAAMSLTAAARGFVVFLLSVSVIQGQDDWGVTYTSTEICAVKGSTVEIHCSYTYPSRINGLDTKVEKTFWFISIFVDLKTDPQYSGRVQYVCDEIKNDCTLRITDLRESDSAVYKFRFITNQPRGKYYGQPGVTLSVTDLDLKVSRSSSSSSLQCHSSCHLPDHTSYIWYKNGQKIKEDTSPYVYFSYDSADSYSCAVKGCENFPSPSVYAPKLPSVSVSPSAEIVEGSSVTLTCSSDANPAANYTWHKKNGNLFHHPQRQEPQLVFSSIQSSVSGEYYCTAVNELGRRTSNYILDVKYAPKLPSVSVSPSAEIVEGSSVTLTCSSDANPAANYTWYKENEDSPKASGQIFTITDITAEHSGNYSCEAQNTRGRHNSTLHLTVVADHSVMNIIRLTLVVLVLTLLLLLSLWTRKKKTLSFTTEPQKPVEIELKSCPAYENVSDAAAQTEDTEEQEDLMQLNQRRDSPDGNKVVPHGNISVEMIQGQKGWGVTYTSTEICAVKGSTVEIHCSYRYPSRINGLDTKVEKAFWFIEKKDEEYVDLKTDPQYLGRVQYDCDETETDCTLRITDLRESDSAVYKFRFITNQPGGKYWGHPGVTLSVTDLDLKVSRSSSSSSLQCHSSRHLPDHTSYIWYKNGQKIKEGTSPYVYFSYDSADSYSCAVKGCGGFSSPSVYAPKLPSVSVSPSAEIVEGSSVTLTCRSDANPAAKYTWYKKNGHLFHHPQRQEPQLVFSSIQSSDSGEYYCTTENELGRRTSNYISIDVKYAPKLPSVSVSPSAEIVEGSSVTLTCSSDANPAANYTWYKENEDSPKASGQIFTISNVTAEHSGNYYCEAQNTRGRHNSTLHLTVVAGAEKLVAAGTITVVLLAVILLAVFLWIRKKRASRDSSEPGERADNREQVRKRQPEEQGDLQYASIHFSNNQADPLYSNMRPAQPLRHTEQREDVEYVTVKFNSARTAPRTRGRGGGEDPAALYSTVNKTR